MPVLDGGRDSCSSKINSSNCLLYKRAVTSVCLSKKTSSLSSKQLLLFVLTRRSVYQYSMTKENPAARKQTAITAYFTSKQLLPLVFAQRSVCQYLMAEENPALQKLLTFQVSSYCCLSSYVGHYATTRWQKSILQLKDKQQ